MRLANFFPDTREKRELRRRDYRYIKEFCKRTGMGPLRYVGLPSVEFLDVVEWAPALCNVVAVERDPDTANQMRLNSQLKSFGVPVRIVEQDIYEFIGEGRDFDVYNLDFYGGMTYARESNTSACIEALQELFKNQRTKKASFILIATFQVRDSGTEQYLGLLDQVEQQLAALDGSRENVAEHREPHVRRLKLCFPYSCALQAHANGFEQILRRVTTYRSSVNMIHFHMWFLYKDVMLPSTDIDSWVDLANKPLYQLRGQVMTVRFMPTQITSK